MFRQESIVLGSALALALATVAVAYAGQAEPTQPSGMPQAAREVAQEKVERQQDRIGSAIDDKLDQTTDNAVDKVLGAILLGKATPRSAIYTTGRLTSDMVLKCARMGIPIIMSRTAPSSLGMAIARRSGATLVAYARPDRLNVFNAPERIISEP